MYPDSPERTAVLAASAEWQTAGKVRAALGGYVPVGHPGHPSRWSRERREELAEADADVTRTTAAMRIALKTLRDVS